MNADDRNSQDAFMLSFGGGTLRNPVLPIPAIDANCINRAIAVRLAQEPEDQPDTGEALQSFWYRLWHRALRRAA